MLLLAIITVGLPACGSGGDTAGAPTTSRANSVPSTSSTPTAPPLTAAPSTATPSTQPPGSTTTAPPPTAPPAAPPPRERVLGRGARGEDVAAVQARLLELRFWVAQPPTGVFDTLTQQAVYAFQKANGIAVDGRVGPVTRAKLAEPAVLETQTAAGTVVEVDKGRQLLFAVSDGELRWIFHTSTGTERRYRHPSGHWALADTPAGRHDVIWQVDGWREGRLGPMYRPKYFHRDGIAVHGYGKVPTYPASHGCVRVTFEAMDFIWKEGLMPLEGGTVVVYGSTPGAP